MASELQKKWPINQTAAQLLKDKGLHVSVVHCAYYACVQLMKHIVIYHIGISSQQIETQVRNSTSSTHAFLINEILKLLRNEKADWSSFNRKINDLKSLRNDADYSDDLSISNSESNRSITLSDDVVKILKHFQ